jgi:hypothetical protein
MKNKVIFFYLIGCFSSIYSGVFDNRLPSAQATAMSDATVAVVNDVWASYYNPAGLARLDGYQFATAVQRPFNQTFFFNGFIGAAMPITDRFGSAAFNAECYGVRYNGNDLSTEITLTLSHGFHLLKDMNSTLSFGYSVKYYHWNLGESVGGLKLGSAGAFGVDIGAQASLWERTYAGFYAYNINAPKIGAETAHDLPQRLVMGAAYRPFSGLITSLAFDKTVGYDTHIRAGFEFLPAEWIALRVGASTNPNRFSFGFGLNFKGINVDYSFNSHPVLPETHKFGLAYRFGVKE